MRTLGKRGMSPLIATVLLMAFAVALGGMIMNWQGELKSIDCSEVQVEMIRFCYDEQAISIDARNIGEEDIAELVLQISNPSSGDFEIAVPKSSIGRGSTTNAKVPFLVTDSTTVSIFASIDNHGEAEMCSEPAEVKQPLPKC